MALITWTQEAYGTNVTVADDQHKELFRMLNALHETAAGTDRKATGQQLDDLIGYVAMHFQTEERMMQEKGYPDFVAHKAEHDKLVGVCLDLQKQFHAGQAEVNQDTTRFVKDWLDSHIPKIDMPYGPYLGG